jgi:hypothetical protein
MTSDARKQVSDADELANRHQRCPAIAVLLGGLPDTVSVCLELGNLLGERECAGRFQGLVLLLCCS